MGRNIMIQGTMSNAGKSLFAAGLLRILRQDGYTAAPFKSQNMSLNSFVTPEGLEIGRAQAMQAEAAGIVPEAAMNPVLLKPNSDLGSQVIVNGEVTGNMQAAEYFRRKKEYIPDILAAYHKLEQKYEVIVLEGAGSPAEINLKENDIVNMGMAKMVDAPVVLVGDIDRGGVFAQLYGTAALLDETERRRIGGFVMNKFRGDKDLLTPGIRMLYDKCPIPVIGVIPYANLDIEEEDSLSERLFSCCRPERIDIVVVRFPHLSNFTDFNALQNIEDVSLRYVTAPKAVENPDLVILPGTKNTMYDLQWMRQNGMEEKIKKLARSGKCLVLGICGGFQMLGQELSDPHEMERGGQMQGMGLLPLRTVFAEKKVRRQVCGSIIPVCSGAWQALSGSSFSGYEIHMGRTECMRETGRTAQITALDGSISADGYMDNNCMGTYVHGIFDSGTLRNHLLQLLFDRKGIVWKGKKTTDYRTHKNKQYDMLADLIRENTDMKAVYRMMGLV